MSSLQAIWIRNEVVSAIGRYSEEGPKRFTCNLVYSYPTVMSLALHIYQRLNDGDAQSPYNAISKEEKTLNKMRDLVEKYSQNFPVHTPADFEHLPVKEAVLLTGSTGGLGSYLLESLLLKSDISRVFVLNRPGDVPMSSPQRQIQSFHARGIDPNFLDFSKIRFLEGNMSLPRLGLDEQVYEELRREVTCIMHIGE